MKKFKNYVLAATGVVALALTITLMNTNHAGAQQAVTPQAIAPPPQKPPKPPSQVEVVNPVLGVFDIDNARQPFQISTQLGSSFVVPADRRLVIEYVSIRAHGALGGYLAANLETSVNNVITLHELGFAPSQQTNINSYFASLPVRIYADPGTNVSASANSSGGPTGTLTVSGYLVDVSKFEGIPF